MNNPREPFERLFAQFDDVFARVGAAEGFGFNPKSGPNLSRSLRQDMGLIKRGVFLEIKDHWMKSNPNDPEVIFSYGVWVYDKENRFPFWLLERIVYIGPLSGLQSPEDRLRLAVSEVKKVSEATVRQDGRLFKG